MQMSGQLVFPAAETRPQRSRSHQSLEMVDRKGFGLAVLQRSLQALSVSAFAPLLELAGTGGACFLDR